MKELRFFIVLCAVVGLARAAAGDTVNGISVVVNDSVITYAEINAEVMKHLQTLFNAYRNQPEVYQREKQKLQDEIVELLVERKLILHEFVSGGYITNLLEALIDDRIRDEIQRDYYGDSTRLIKSLQAEGMTYEMYRTQERERFIIDYMTYQNARMEKIVISPKKIESYYKEHPDEFKMDEQVKLRMIVVSQPPGAQPGMARKVAQEILDKIDDGVPFAEMAAVYSAGSQRASGGDRGWVDRKYFRPELSTVAFSLQTGHHSGVIELPDACYLIMVEDKRGSHIRPLSEVHAEIEQKLQNEEGRRLKDRWIIRLKSKSFIQYY